MMLWHLVVSVDWVEELGPTSKPTFHRAETLGVSVLMLFYTTLAVVGLLPWLAWWENCNI